MSAPVNELTVRLNSLYDDLHDLFGRHEEIARILANFYRAPLTMASVQPILDLAVELNPELKTAAFKYPAVMEEVK